MIRFCYNPTSWHEGAPVPAGMADALVQPILPHLTVPYELVRYPEPGAVNVYYAHRSKYGRARPRKERSVFVSHGIADKGWREGTRLRGQFFDAVFTSGPAWTEKTRRTRYPGPIYEVGYTKLDPIFQRKIRPLRRKNGKVRVVWAPTHGGGGERGHLRPAQAANGGKFNPTSTWGRAGEVMDLLPLSEFDVVAAPHPRHRFNPDVRAELLDMGVTLSDGKATLAEYVGADVVIADGGSTIYEAWALDIPVVFPDWLTAAGNITRFARAGGPLEAQIYRERIGRHAIEPADLPRLVVEAAEQGIKKAEQEFIEPIFPRRYRGISGRLHAEALDTIHAEHTGGVVA